MTELPSKGIFHHLAYRVSAAFIMKIISSQGGVESNNLYTNTIYRNQFQLMLKKMVIDFLLSLKHERAM